MKRKLIQTLILTTAIILFAGVSSFAAGYPFAVLTPSGSTKVIVLGKFDSSAGQFTQSEAQEMTATVAPIIKGLLKNLVQTDIAVLTPNDLKGYDADTLKPIVKNGYKSWGYTLYAYVDITKTAEYVKGFGPNMRLDVYIADMALYVGVVADYLYAASIEVPYKYTSFLNFF
jgi:hypothetical protein